MKRRNSGHVRDWGALACLTLMMGVTITRVWAEENTPTSRGSLVIVADASASYASYSFELPERWHPVLNTRVLAMTQDTGFWVGEHMDRNATLEISPNKKDPEQGPGSLDDFVKMVRDANLNAAHCSSGAITEYASFKSSTRYPYRAQLTSNCPVGVMGLLVFVDLPDHIVMFNLYAPGNDVAAINPYMNDLEQALNTFSWLLSS